MFKDIGSYWNKYGDFLMDGIIITLEISLLSILIGLIMGFLIGFARNIHITRKDNVFTKSIKIGIKYILDGYISFFRYTPFIAQAFFFHYVFFTKLNLFVLSTVAMSLNTSTYIAIIMQGGIQSVDNGQYQAGRSLGLSHIRTYSTIIMPQAFRNMVPALSNEFVNVIKATSVLSIMGVHDLFYWIDKYNGTTGDAAIGYTISLIIYFVICLAFMMLLRLINYILERRR